MSTNKKASALDPNLLASQVKDVEESGQAIPSELKAALEELVKENLKAGRERAGHRSKTLSLKVEPETYKRLSRARFETERSGQDIMSEALDLWLKKNNF